MTSPGGPSGSEDMPYWPVSTNAPILFGLRAGIGHVAGFIQPTVTVGATPAALGVGGSIKQSYFYGGVNMSAVTDHYEGLMLEADGAGQSFLRDVFSMVGNVIIESTGLGPIIRPFDPFRPTSDVEVVVQSVTLSFSGAVSNVFIFVDESRLLDNEEGITPGSLNTGQRAQSTLLAGRRLGQPGGIPFLEVALGAPLNGRKHSAIVVRSDDNFQVIGEPLFPAAIGPGEVFHVVGTGGLRASIVWSEYG